MTFQVSRRIKGIPWRVPVVSFVILSMLALGYPQGVQRSGVTGKRTAPGIKQTPAANKRSLGKPKDPEAVALFMHLLERYAKNVSDKSEMDKRVEQAHANNPGSREIAGKMVARFRNLTLSERQAVLGQYADISADKKISSQEYNAVFQRLTSAGANAKAQLAEPAEPRTRTNLSPKHSKPENSNDREAGSPPVRQPASPDRKPGERKPIKRSAVPGEQQPMPVYLAAMQQTLYEPSSGGGRFAFPWKEQPAPIYQDSDLPRFVMGSMQQAPKKYRLWYEGLRCRSETDDDGSSGDEIYIIAAVTDSEGHSSTTRHPQPHDPHWYIRLDDGETRRGPRRRVWGGGEGKSAQNLTLTVSVFERDSGNPEDTEKAMELMWTTAGAICAATTAEAPVICVVGLLAGLVINLAVDIFTGGEDDLVEVKTKNITADQIRNWDERDPNRRGNIFYHFSTVHQNYSGNAAGADYQVYFRITSPLPFE